MLRRKLHLSTAHSIYNPTETPREENAMPATTAEPPTPATGLSQIERVADTFVAPSTAFRDIHRSSSWWLPFLLTALVSLGFAFTIDRQVGFDQVAETQMHLSASSEERLASLTPPERAAQMQKIAAGYRYGTYASPLLVLGFSALGSLVLWISFNFGLGARTTYPQVFCLWMLANLPRVLASLVTIVTLCFGGSPETFDMKQPAGTNIGYYLADAAPWLRTLLGFVDVIGIWVLVLLILGGAIVAKVSKVQAAAVVIGWWLLVVLLSTVGTAMFS